MSTLDIREISKVVEIKFDNSIDRLTWTNDGIEIKTGSNITNLFCWENFDNFIKALYKAKELAGK